ncbi:ROK family protein [Bifidobacterium sp. ESL0745]|uniref:ROK family protein n=1 Tax=Bifidobacterium sp. ESL0745 TaxID=2983226 RepID=UPI0023F7D9C4|nr:ROK family protein [Bifidobacterium sp. ESL0745]MDF7664709.1 ROK family protein [Bifidobacterium sp. ESL0745]
MIGKPLKSDPSDVRAKNIRTAFQLVAYAGAISRAELGRLMGLSRMAVSDLVNEMMENHLLRQAGLDRRQGRGKRSLMVTVDTDHWRVASVDMTQRFVIRGALTDLMGRIVDRVETPLGDDAQSHLQMVDELLGKLLAMTSHPILGLGVAVPGVIDAEGTVVRSVSLGWTEIPLQTHLKQERHIPTVVCNDVNMGLLGECTFGKGSRNSLFVRIGRGVGAGVCLNGTIIDGSGYSAGEIGHVVVDPNGPQCVCGKRGCLEMMVNVPRLRERIESHPDKRDDILGRGGNMLGDALAMSVSLLDLSDISVDGPADIIGPVFLQALRDELEAKTNVDYRRQPVIHRCEQGDDLVLRGQAVEVIRSFVDSIHSRRESDGGMAEDETITKTGSLHGKRMAGTSKDATDAAKYADSIERNQTA